MDKFWLFFLQFGDQYVYVNDSGEVQFTTDMSEWLANPLRNSLHEWTDVAIAWERSESLKGFFTAISGDYTTSGDAATIIRYIAFTYGYTAKLTLHIYKTSKVDLLPYFWGKNDILFDKPEVSRAGTVKIRMVETGIAQDFRNNLDTPYEIEMSGADLVDTIHEGTTVRGTYAYKYADTYCSNTVVRDDKFEVFSLSIGLVNSDGKFPIAETKSIDSIRMGVLGAGTFYGVSDPQFSDQYNRWILRAGQNIKDVKITLQNCKFKWSYIPLLGSSSPGTIYDCRFFVWVVVAKDRAPIRIYDQLYAGPVIPVVNATSIDIYEEDVSISNFDIGEIYEDEAVYLVMGITTATAMPNSTGSTIWGFLINTFEPENSRVTIQTDFDSKPTQVQGFRWYKMWEKLVDKFAGGKYAPIPGKSPYMSDPTTFEKGSYPYRVILTNGQILKGAVGTKTKITMKTMVEDAMSNYPVAVGPENGDTLVIDHISKFYDTSYVIADVGELTNGKIYPLADFGTIVETGHQYDRGDVVNGVFDYCTKSTHKISVILEAEKRTQFLSQINASIYNMEDLRVAQYGKNTTASESTEDVYKYSVVGTPEGSNYKIRYAGRSPEFYEVSTAAGYANTRYNVEFSPGNMLNRLKGIINSNSWPSVLPLKFQISDRNGVINSRFKNAAGTAFLPRVYDSQEITPGNTELYWLPFKVTGTCVLDEDFEAAMMNNPFGIVRATFRGVPIEIHLNRVKFVPKSRNSFDIEGVLSKNVDISKLIYLI